MTREEAINLISRNKSVFQHDKEMLEALDMAIRALKQVPKYRKKERRWKNLFLAVKKELDDSRRYPFIDGDEEVKPSVAQEDVADILNAINDALDDTKYVAVGYDNTRILFEVLIDKK